MAEKEAQTSELEDFKISVKLKLSGLWTSVMFCYVYGDYFSLYVPEQLAHLISGDNLLNSPSKLFMASVLMTVPALMIFLSLALKPRINRWLNIITGLIFTAIMLLIAVTSLSTWWIFYVFLAIIESCLTAYIVWNAWYWPKN